MGVRIIIFMLFASFAANGQIVGNYLKQNISVSSGVIDAFTFDVDIIQRTNEAIVLTASPTTNVTITDYRWEVRQMSDDLLVGLSFDRNASISTVTNAGLYYVTFKARSSTDQYIKRWDDIVVHYPQFTEGEADVVVNLASGNYYQDFLEADNSGLKIYVKGSGTAQFQVVGLFGTAGNPVRVQKEIGNTDISQACPNGTAHAIYVYGNNEHIIFDGFNTDKTIGWNVAGDPTNSAQVVSASGGFFTDIQFIGMGLSHVNNGVINAAAFSLIPVTNSTYNASNSVAENMWVIGCTITNAGEEGIYMGYNNDQLQSSYRPLKFRDAVIAWNVINGSGRDGIQPGGCVNIRVHNNTLTGWGVQQDASHESAISWNSGNYGKCYENYCSNGEMFLNIQSGATPWDIEGAQTTPQLSEFYGNVFINGTYTGSPGSEAFSIYVQNSGSETTSSDNWPVRIYNNTLKSDKKLLEAYFHASSFVWTDFKMVNNLIVKVGSAGDTDEANYVGPGTQPTGTLQNNLIRDVGSESDILFTNYSGNDLTLYSFSSPAYTGATDVSSYNGDYGVDGLPLLLTHGAYSGYEKKTITPTLGDANPATFSGAVAIGSINNTGGTITYEANKVGQLYWVVVANGATEPSITQVRAGYNASGVAALDFGQIIDSGTASSEVITGLTESTAYDHYSVFVTVDNVAQAANTKVDFTTTADVTAPILSAFNITDTNRDRIYFTSSEIITGTTYSGFTVAAPSKTINAISINAGQLTGHYFTVSVAFTASDQAPIIAYSSGSNIQDVAGTPNTLATFGATGISNDIVPESQEYIVWTDLNNTTAGSNGDLDSDTGSADARSTQIIPSDSDGYIVHTWNTDSRSDFQGMRFGLIASGDARTYANLKMSIDLRSANTNVDVYQGTTYKTTVSGGTGIQASGYQHRFRIDRTTQKVYYETSPDGGSWTTRYTHDATVTGDLKAGYVSNDATKLIKSAAIQADNGLN